MTTGPINPVECAQNAIRAGILTPAERIEEVFRRADAQWNEKHMGELKTPEEAGIARLPSCPKRDRRTGPKPKQVRRYIITKGEALAKGYELP